MQIFRSYYVGEILKTRHSPVNLNLCFRKTLAEKSCDFRDAIVFKMSFVHTKTQNRRLQIPPVEVEKLRFRDGLARTLGLTLEIKRHGMTWTGPTDVEENFERKMFPV